MTSPQPACWSKWWHDALQGVQHCVDSHQQHCGFTGGLSAKAARTLCAELLQSSCLQLKAMSQWGNYHEVESCAPAQTMAHTTLLTLVPSRGS